MALWNTEQISLFVKQLIFSLMKPNIFKCWGFEESTVVVLDTRCNMTSTYGTNYFIVKLFTNEKTV